MGIFHSHKFVDVKTTFTPPVERKFDVSQPPNGFMDRTMFGFTTLLQKCNCGKYKETIFIGKVLEIE